MSSGAFSITLYGQDRLAMDYADLADPFTQNIPIKIANNDDQTNYFEGELVSPAAWYSSYSGIMVRSGLATGANDTGFMTWNVSTSGRIAGSGIVTDNLSLRIIAYTSSNFTGERGRQTVTIPNVLFNRWSGVIKVFGDIYSNDQPTPTASAGTPGSAAFDSGQAMRYAVSYMLSGWESDVGAPSASVSLTSGQNISVSWASVAGATQYFLWRWSGTTASLPADFTIYSGTTPPNAGTLRLMDLVYASNQLSFTDNNPVSVLGSGFFRHRTWQLFRISGTTDGTLVIADANVFLSPPQSRLQNNPGVVLRNTKSFQLNKNVSGNLSGNYYLIIHTRNRNNLGSDTLSFMLSENNDASVSGTVIADETVFDQLLSGIWYRHCFYISGLSSSGYITVQIGNLNTVAASRLNFDDVFIVSRS